MSRQLCAAAWLAALIAVPALPQAAHAQFALSFFAPPSAMSAYPPQLQIAPQAPVEEEDTIADRFRRRIVDYPSREKPGTIVVDTPNTYLYFILGGGKAIRYGIGVGREGFTWSGVRAVARKAEWPDWYPPPAMIGRQPYLPRMMAGGPGNPLGARALYIGGTEYRIHGTNNPASIGKRVSSGCIRLSNADVIDLFERVKIGAKVIVLPTNGPRHEEAHATRRTFAASSLY